MKKKIFASILSVLLIISIFTGCGAAKNTAADTMAPGAVMEPSRGEDYYYDMDMPEMEATEDGYYDGQNYTSTSGGSVADVIQSASKTYNLDTEKIIYTAYADIETLEFDDTVQAVYDMMERFGAYIENSSVSGTDYATKYYGGKSHRNANFTVRVPVQHYSEMSVGLTEIGNVTNYSSESRNITAQFTDTESRLKAYRTEYNRLLEMMENANTVEEMIQVEARLSEVEYNIESLTGTLRVWQDKVDYSTIHIYIREVYEYTEPVVVPKTFWDRIVEALEDSLDWLAEAGQDIVIFIVAAVPILIVPAVVVVVVILIVRSKRKKRKAAEEERAAQLRKEWAEKNKES